MAVIMYGLQQSVQIEGVALLTEERLYPECKYESRHASFKAINA